MISATTAAAAVAVSFFAGSVFGVAITVCAKRLRCKCEDEYGLPISGEIGENGTIRELQP